MPISSDTTKLSIDFAYEWTTPDGNIITYQMKFTHGQWGPIIAISNEGGTVEFPADMFSETTEFLVQQGVMAGSLAMAPVAVLGRKNKGTPLAMPVLSKKTDPLPASQGPMGVAAARRQSVTPFQSLDPEVEHSEEPLPAPVVKKKPLEPDERPDARPQLTGKEGVTKEQADAILAERTKAKEEAQKKGVEEDLSLANKRRHRPQDAVQG